MNEVFWKMFLAALVAIIMQAAWAFGEVRLAEVLPDPASDWNSDGEIDTRDDEWLEVRNDGPETVDLADYWIRDALGETPHLRLSGSLAPGEHAVFYGSDAAAWQAESGIGGSALSLNNGGDEIGLYLGRPDEGGQLVDLLIYPAHVGVDDRSAAWLPSHGVWVLFDALNPYGGDLEPVSSGCSPSPDDLNECVDLVPVGDSSWGEVKDRYR